LSGGAIFGENIDGKKTTQTIYQRMQRI